MTLDDKINEIIGNIEKAPDSEIEKQLVDWFHKNANNGRGWDTLITYRHPINKDIIAIKFSKAEDKHTIEGFLMALTQLGIPSVSQTKGFDVWYMYKGKIPYKVCEGYK